MKKLLAILIAASLLLTACAIKPQTDGEQPQEKSDVADSKEDAKVEEEEKSEPKEEVEEEIPLPDSELILWHSFSDDLQTELERLIEVYNNSDRGIKVKAVKQEAANLKAATDAAHTGEVDLLIAFPFEITKDDAGSFIDLNNYINNEKFGIVGFDKVLSGKPAQEGNEMGGRYMIPIVKTGELVYYNKTILDSMGIEPPKTWDEMAQVSERILNEKGINGFAAESGSELADLLISQYGDDVYRKDDFSLIQPKIIEAMIKLQNSYNLGSYKAPSEEGSLIGAFESGQLAMYMTSSYYSLFLNSEEIDFEVGYSPLPQNPEKPYQPLIGPSIGILKTDESRQRAAFDFIKYFISEETNIEFVKKYHGISPFNYTTNAAYTEYLNANPAMKVLSGTIKDAGSIPAVKGIIEARSHLKDIVNRIAAGEAVEDVLNSVGMEINELFKK